MRLIKPITDGLGYRFRDLAEAREFALNDKVVVTDNNQIFFIVDREKYEKDLFPFDYKIV